MKRISKCQLWRLLKGYWASSNLMLGKISIIGVVAAILMIPTAPSAQVGGAISPGVHVGGAVNPGATVRGAVVRGIRSAGRTGVAVVSSRELDEQAVSVGASGCSGRTSNGTNETGNGFGGDRSCHRGRCALWLRVGGCRLWAERAVPSGAPRSQTCLGSRYSPAPPGVACQCADDLASCKAWSSPSAARS